MELTQEYFCEIFEYSEESPSCLIRKVPVYRGSPLNPNRSIQINTGAIVGCKEVRMSGKDQAWYTKIGGKRFGVHNIIYIMHFGNIPHGYVIDHINRNPYDNRIQNLRAIPQSVNCRNRNKSKLNTSGVTGVHFESGKGCMYWNATWNDGKPRVKRFSVKIYGYDEAKQLAIEFRAAKIAELNSLGYGYTEDHGM